MQYQKLLSQYKVKKIIIDEIYTFYHHLYLYDNKGEKLRRRNRSYLFNAIIILKNGVKLPFFKIYSSISEESLSDFLTLLPDAEEYFSDGAKIYQDCWLKKFVAKKSKETNIIESFNFYCRNFNPCLRRRTVCFAKTIQYFNQRMIEVIIRWNNQFNFHHFLRLGLNFNTI